MAQKSELESLHQSLSIVLGYHHISTTLYESGYEPFAYWPGAFFTLWDDIQTQLGRSRGVPQLEFKTTYTWKQDTDDFDYVIQYRELGSINEEWIDLDEAYDTTSEDGISSESRTTIENLCMDSYRWVIKQNRTPEETANDQDPTE